MLEGSDHYLCNRAGNFAKQERCEQKNVVNAMK